MIRIGVRDTSQQDLVLELLLEDGAVGLVEDVDLGGDVGGAVPVSSLAHVEAGLVPGGAREDEGVPPLSLLTTEHGPRLEMIRHFIIIPSLVEHETYKV